LFSYTYSYLFGGKFKDNFIAKAGLQCEFIMKFLGGIICVPIVPIAIGIADLHRCILKHIPKGFLQDKVSYLGSPPWRRGARWICVLAGGLILFFFNPLASRIAYTLPFSKGNIPYPKEILIYAYMV